MHRAFACRAVFGRRHGFVGRSVAGPMVCRVRWSSATLARGPRVKSLRTLIGRMMSNTVAIRGLGGASRGYLSIGAEYFCGAAKPVTKEVIESKDTPVLLDLAYEEDRGDDEDPAWSFSAVRRIDDEGCSSIRTVLCRTGFVGCTRHQ